MIPRPRLRLPIWAAIAIVMAAYTARSVLVRGGDFSPDLPGDAIVAVTLAVAVGFVAYSRYRRSREDAIDPHDGGPDHFED